MAIGNTLIGRGLIGSSDDEVEAIDTTVFTFPGFSGVASSKWSGALRIISSKWSGDLLRSKWKGRIPQ